MLFKRVIFLVFFVIGIFLLVQIAMPVIGFEYWELTSYQQNITLLSPDPNTKIVGVSIKNQGDFPALYSTNQRLEKPLYSEFTIKIPSINLASTRVRVDDNNFDNNLGHLPGSALPGEVGNVFITGHSSLPEFFRPDNFKAIFTNLIKIQKGDKIQVSAGGQNFTYIVQGLKIVNPSATWVINPPDNTGRYLTLMTCVPPGFFWNRLIVLTRLQS